MDIQPRGNEKLGDSRTLVSKKNVENTLDRQGSTCDVFRRAGVEKGLLQDIFRRQIKFIGHVIRKDELENVVLTGYVEGTREPGKQPVTFLTCLRKRKGIKDTSSHRQRYVDTVV